MILELELEEICCNIENSTKGSKKELIKYLFERHLLTVCKQNKYGFVWTKKDVVISSHQNSDIKIEDRKGLSKINALIAFCLNRVGYKDSGGIFDLLQLISPVGFWNQVDGLMLMKDKSEIQDD